MCEVCVERNNVIFVKLCIFLLMPYLTFLLQLADLSSQCFNACFHSSAILSKWWPWRQETACDTWSFTTSDSIEQVKFSDGIPSEKYHDPLVGFIEFKSWVNALHSQCLSPPRSINGYWQIVSATWKNALENFRRADFARSVTSSRLTNISAPGSPRMVLTTTIAQSSCNKLVSIIDKVKHKVMSVFILFCSTLLCELLAP